MVGLIIFQWFQGCASHSASTIINGRNLMRQVYLPKVIFPIITILMDSVRFAFFYNLTGSAQSFLLSSQLGLFINSGADDRSVMRDCRSNISMAVMRERIRSNKTIVLVSHNEQTLLNLCDRAVWIEDGVSQLEGGVRTVMEAYRQSIR